MISSLCRHSARLRSFPFAVHSQGGGAAAQLHNTRSHSVLNKLSFLDDIASFAPNLNIQKIRADSLVFLSNQSEQRTPRQWGGRGATWGCVLLTKWTNFQLKQRVGLLGLISTKQLLKTEWKGNEYDLSKELHNCHCESTCQGPIPFPCAPKQIYYTHIRNLGGRQTLGGKDWSDYN